ncbi:hypothetical protein V6N13_125324 [Hibiscus sabdariffa]
MLNGFKIYGHSHRITVEMAKFNGSTLYRRKVRPSTNHFSEQDDVNKWKSVVKKNQAASKSIRGQKEKLQEIGGVEGESSKQQSKFIRRISGHVEKEDMWKMRKWLVGVMATVCSVRSRHGALER